MVATLDQVHGDEGRAYWGLIAAGLEWIALAAPRDGNRLWLSPDLNSTDHASLKLVSGFRVYRSASRGVAGVIYVLSKLHRLGWPLPSSAAEDISRSIDWLLDHAPTADDQMAGLHFGEAGVAVSIAEAIAADLLDVGPWTLPYFAQALTGSLDWPDLSHGAAGQGMAALVCSELLKRQQLGTMADRCADYLQDSQQPDGSWALPHGVNGMEGAVYTGFAHGVAGIVSFLAEYAHRSSHPTAAEAATRGGEWLLDQARANRGGTSVWFPLRTDSDEAWNWWCHGSPGVSLAFLALFTLTGDDDYAGAARACLRAHPVEVRYTNLSQCHGLSGLGEILLAAYHALGEQEWLGPRRAGMARPRRSHRSKPRSACPDRPRGCQLARRESLRQHARPHDRKRWGPSLPSPGVSLAAPGWWITNAKVPSDLGRFGLSKAQTTHPGRHSRSEDYPNASEDCGQR